MSLVNVGGAGILLPHFFGAARRDIHGTGVTLSAAGHKYGFTFRVPRTGTIDRVGFPTRAVTTSQPLRAGLETVDTTNFLATGTQYGGSAAGTQASPAANTFYESVLATPASAVRGDIISMVVQFDSTAGNLVIGTVDNEGGNSSTAFPFVAAFTTAWAKSPALVAMNSIRYSDGVYEPVGQCIPSAPRVDTFFNSGSAINEIGNRFTVAGPMRTTGVFSAIGHVSAAVDYILYEGTTVRRTTSIAAGEAATSGYETEDWSTPYVLVPGVEYVLAVKPTTTTNVNVREAVVLNNAMLNMLPGGVNWYKASRSGTGAWTFDTLRRIWALGLLYDQIDNGVRSPRLRRAA